MSLYPFGHIIPWKLVDRSTYRCATTYTQGYMKKFQIGSILLFVFLLKGRREYQKIALCCWPTLFCSCLKANRCLLGISIFRYPKQNSHFPTQISSSHCLLCLRKWWVHSSIAQAIRAWCPLRLDFCSLTPNSNHQHILLVSLFEGI